MDVQIKQLFAHKLYSQYQLIVKGNDMLMFCLQLVSAAPSGRKKSVLADLNIYSFTRPCDVKSFSTHDSSMTTEENSIC